MMYQHRRVPSVWSFTDSTSIKMKVHSKSGGNDEPRVKKKKKKHTAHRSKLHLRYLTTLLSSPSFHFPGDELAAALTLCPRL